MDAIAPKEPPTVLVVDDENMVRTIMTQVLREKGYRMLEAGNGVEALRVAQEHNGRIDLLLTDIKMPGMSGLELADHLAALRPETVVLYVSGHAGKTFTKEIVLQEGQIIIEPGSNFLQKPFSPERLLAKVKNILEPSSV